MNSFQVFRELISHTPEGVDKKKIVESVTVEDPLKNLGPLVRTEARVFLLYSTEKEAQEIFKVSTMYKSFTMNIRYQIYLGLECVTIYQGFLLKTV